MPKFSKISNQRKNTCDPKLIELFDEVIKHYDCIVLYGHRNKAEQNQAYAESKSKVKWPNSKHNTTPSKAIDVAPYPINWNDRERFIYFAGIVKGIATQKNIKIRWGGDWDEDYQLKDNMFDDLVHFEVVE